MADVRRVTYCFLIVALAIVAAESPALAGRGSKNSSQLVPVTTMEVLPTRLRKAQEHVSTNSNRSSKETEQMLGVLDHVLKGNSLLQINPKSFPRIPFFRYRSVNGAKIGRGSPVEFVDVDLKSLGIVPNDFSVPVIDVTYKDWMKRSRNAKVSLVDLRPYVAPPVDDAGGIQSMDEIEMQQQGQEDAAPANPTVIYQVPGDGARGAQAKAIHKIERPTAASTQFLSTPIAMGVGLGQLVEDPRKQEGARGEQGFGKRLGKSMAVRTGQGLKGVGSVAGEAALVGVTRLGSATGKAALVGAKALGKATGKAALAGVSAGGRAAGRGLLSLMRVPILMATP